MGAQGSTWWQRTRAANQRATAWMDDPPWRNGLIAGTLFSVMFTTLRYFQSGDWSWTRAMFLWVMFFGVGTGAAVRRSRRAANRPAAHDAPFPSRRPTTDEKDGRRWRSDRP